MNRSRSVSRRPPSRFMDDGFAPARSRSRSSSYREAGRPRSQSRGPPPPSHHHHHRPEHVRGAASSGLSKSAGVLAGIGIAALVAHTLWPKSRDNNNNNSSSGSSSSQVEKEDRRGGSHPRRRSSSSSSSSSNAQEHVPRGCGVQRRAHQHPSTAFSRDYGQGRCATRGDESGHYFREPQQRGIDRRSWSGEVAQSQMQSSLGYGRRYS
ncbi:hypothetical protein V2A60_005927 [Cordyceps javanica]